GSIALAEIGVTHRGHRVKVYIENTVAVIGLWLGIRRFRATGVALGKGGDHHLNILLSHLVPEDGQTIRSSRVEERPVDAGAKVIQRLLPLLLTEAELLFQLVQRHR